MKGKEPKNNGFLLLLISFALLTLLFAGCFGSPPAPTQTPSTNSGPAATPITAPPSVPLSSAPSVCQDKDCFISAANACQTSSLVSTEDFGVVSYSTKNCSFTKTIVSLDVSEPADMKAALEGKSLTCQYEKGNFRSEWANSLILGIGNCNGSLADALSELAVFATD